MNDPAPHPLLPPRGPAEALLIRQWALGVLGTERGPAECAWELALSSSPESWRLFLGTEAIALPLGLRLRQTGDWRRLPAELAAEIRGRAQPELQRSISARANLKKIARLAAEGGWKAIVLKGGVVAAAGRQIDLLDIDILVDVEEIRDFTRALEAAGFAAMGVDRLTSEHHHLVARMAPQSLPIEVHHRILGGGDLDAIFDRALPLDGHPGLWRLGPADHLGHLLRHITLQHPDRASRLRDLLVIAHALEECSPTDLEAVESRFSGREEAPKVSEILRLAGALRDLDWKTDALESSALCSYIIAERYAGVENGALKDHLVLRARLHAVSTRSWRQEYREYQGKSAATIDATPIGDWLRRRLPAMADAIQYVIRIPLFFTGLLLGRSVAREARRIEEELRSESRGSG